MPSTIRYWGDGEQPCDFTTTDDTAAYVAAATTDSNMASRTLKVAGDVLSMKGAINAYQRATGKKLTDQRKGSVEELRAWIEDKKRTAQSPLEYVFQQYHWAMVSGKSKIEPLDNGRYPHIRPKTVEEYVEGARPAIKK